MGSYLIAGLKLEVEGRNTQKVDSFLNEFREQGTIACADCNCKSGVPLLKIIYINVDSWNALNEAKASLVGIQTDKELSEESICYGVRFRTINAGNEQSHILTRENPLTEGLLLATDGWRKLIILDSSINNSNINDWKKKFVQGSTLNKNNEWIELFLTGFYSYAAQHNMMLIHASAVKYRDKAILFTAPSGTGKTTQAELWRDVVNAEIINGDRVFIKSAGDDNKLYAWGSPWSGSSPYIVNDCAEIEAIIVLEQAQENLLQRLDAREAMMQLSANSFLPMWDAKCLEGMLEVMGLVLKKLPVYRLACKLDEEVVELVRKELFE